MTVKYGDIVLFHKKINALGGQIYNSLLAGNHLCQVCLQALYFYSVFCKMFLGIVKMFGTIENCLAWNTSDIEASASKRIISFDKRGFHAQLCTADCAD